MIHPVFYVNSDKRKLITLKDFAWRDIIKRSIAKYNKLNYIEIFFIRQSDYTKESINFILNSYTTGTVNVYLEPYVKKIKDSLIYYYDIIHKEILKPLV